jgi:gliding motility-associated-like protein
MEESEDGIVYHWSFGDGNESSLASPVHEYAYPGEWRVTLEVENLFGCKDAITKTVFVSNDFQVYVPNSFTPNNDGLNDVFKPEMEGKEFIVKYKFQVYDRWGTVIFETEDPESAWIGNTRGNDEYTVNETFKYRLMVEIEQSAETKVFEGLVTVVR